MAVAIFEGTGEDRWVDTGAVRWFDGESVAWPPVKPSQRKKLKKYVTDENLKPTEEWKYFPAKIRRTFGSIESKQVPPAIRSMTNLFMFHRKFSGS